MADGYKHMIDRANTLDELDNIIEIASSNSNITNSEYTDIYAYGLRKAQSWCCVR